MRPIAFALVACFIGRVCAAEPLTPDGHFYAGLSDNDLLQAWSLAHQACLKHRPGACDEADAIDREMPPRGFCYTGAGAEARWAKCDGKTAAASPAPAPAPSQEAAPPALPHEAERQSPSSREIALCEAFRYAMFTSPGAAARVRALCGDIAPSAERWARDAGGRWVLVVPDERWERAPGGLENRQWVYPGRQWRLDPADRWGPVDR
ncbi:MAG: hypothetical protein JO288_13290 [Hyphomicrobiales bacterium]|nr:hypothetical protein [Hyphomicrobiales bacterium]